MPVYPRIIAHRCGGALAPENTLVGLNAAARLGCRGVEFDVMLSRDGIPVLMHDETLERTTDGHGAVAAHDLAALQALDAGLHTGAAWRGEPVPTLADALARCAALGLWANIEIKPSSGREEETAVRVANLLAAQWNGHGIVSSFSESALLVAAKLAPQFPRALLVDAIPADWQARLTRLGCVALHGKAVCCDLGRVAAMKQRGVPVACYTTNDRAPAAALFAGGVAAIFTDRPDLWRPEEM